MRLLSRTIFRELVTTALLWAVLFTFLIFLMRARPLFEFLVRSTGPRSTVFYLFFLVLPQSLPFTVPMGVLVATLITLTRMSTDGEITAMRAAGIPGQRVAPPILLFGSLALLIAAAASLWLTPWTIRERYRIENLLIGNGLTSDVQPRVFEERFPNSIVYVTDVTTGVTGLWKRIFLADITPPEERPPGSQERGDEPRITLATEAVVLADPALNRLQLPCGTAALTKRAKMSATTASPRFRPAIRRWRPASPPKSAPRAHRSKWIRGRSTARPIATRRSTAPRGWTHAPNSINVWRCPSPAC